ncbi:hypothetical protein ACSBL2_02380 [Pedobacter sp. AW31-3R]|uniref:hypothetical protein n=1 Tax=Pedobacter sp. AW31-3R TaxID=3445781 RepID=UPI003F9FB9A1
MGIELADNAAALRMFFTDEVYLVAGDAIPAPVQEPAPDQVAAPVIKAAEAAVTPSIPGMSVPVTPSPAVQDTVFKYVGKNQKKVLILVNDQGYEVSTERGRELLRNLVKAIQLSASDFALVNYSGYEQAQFSEFRSFFSCNLVLAFGVTPVQLGLQECSRNTLVMEGSTQLVFSDNLDLLAVDQQGKKTLWGSLKQLSI